MYSVNITCATGSKASVLHKMPEVPPPAGSMQACYTGPPDIVLGCSNVWHMCALNEQPQRTDQNLMQDKLVERSVVGLYEHGIVAGTTLVRRLHSVSYGCDG